MTVAPTLPLYASIRAYFRRTSLAYATSHLHYKSLCQELSLLFSLASIDIVSWLWQDGFVTEGRDKRIGGRGDTHGQPNAYRIQ